MEISLRPCKNLLDQRWFAIRMTICVMLINLFVIALTGLSLRQSRLQYEERAAVVTRNLAQV